MAIGEAEATLQRWDLFGYLDLLQSIGLDDVTERLSLLTSDRRAVSVVRPLT